MKIVTFNSFPGSPLPYIRNGTLGIGQNSRLSRQLKALGGIGPYDFGCFQEIFSRKAVAAYITQHRKMGMDVVVTDQREFGHNQFHRLMSLALVFLFMCYAWFSFPFVLLVVLVGLSFWIMLAMEEWAAMAFSVMSVNRSGLMTFYKAHRYHLVRSHTLRLPNQSDDFLNIFQPRLALIALFWDVRTRKQIVVVNTHLNAQGSDAARLEQLDFITYYLKRDEEFKHFETYVCGDMNCSLVGVEVHGRLVTWDPGVNPLCNGWMRNLQACQIDYILPINVPDSHTHKLSTHHMDFTSDHYLLESQH